MKRSLTPLLIVVALFASTTAVCAQDDESFPDGDVDPMAPDEDFDFAPEPEEQAPDVDPEEDVENLPSADKISIRWGRVSTSGLSGFGPMITADPLPEALGIRVSFGIKTQHLQMHNSPGDRLEANAQVYTLGASVALMKMIEVSLRIPIIDWELVAHGGAAPPGRLDDKFGLGNPDLAVRFMFPLEMDLLKLGAFARFQPGIGTNNVYSPRRFPMEEGGIGEYELGVLVALDLEIVTIYTNLAFRDFEDNRIVRASSSVRSRIGATLDPMEDMLSIGIFLDFEEFEGTTGLNGYFGLNVDVFLMDMIVVSGGFETLIVDTAFDEMTTAGAKDYVEYFAFNVGVSVLF